MWLGSTTHTLATAAFSSAKSEVWIKRKPHGSISSQSQWFLCLFAQAIVCFSLLCRIPKSKALFIYSRNNSVVIKWMLYNSLPGLWSGNHCLGPLTRDCINCFWILHKWASQVVLVVKNLPANARDVRDTGSISGWERSPRGGHSNPLQYSCLENPMDRGAWRSTVYGITKSQTQLKRISTHAIKSLDQNLHFKTQWTSRTKGCSGNHVCFPLPLVFQSF